MNTTATAVISAAKTTELASIGKVLHGVVADYEVAAPAVVPTRQETVEKYTEDLQVISTDIRQSMKKAAHCRAVHEAQRAQRDIEIINAGPKKMMLACVRASMKRSDKLRREIASMEVSKKDE